MCFDEDPGTQTITGQGVHTNHNGDETTPGDVPSPSNVSKYEDVPVQPGVSNNKDVRGLCMPHFRQFSEHGAEGRGGKRTPKRNAPGRYWNGANTRRKTIGMESTATAAASPYGLPRPLAFPVERIFALTSFLLVIEPGAHTNVPRQKSKKSTKERATDAENVAAMGVSSVELWTDDSGVLTCRSDRKRRCSW